MQSFCIQRLSQYAAAAILLSAPVSIAGWTAIAPETIASARLIKPVQTPLSGYLETIVDPAFGAPLTRITKPGALQPDASIVCAKDRCRHRYSSAQAWNADQSLLLIDVGCNGRCFLDGRTYAPLFRRQAFGECEWRPGKAEQMICVTRNAISLWQPRANSTQAVFQPDNYRNLQFGPSKGNPSRDGDRIAVRALNASGGIVVFAYDLAARKKFADIALDRLPGKPSYCTITPLGLHILCSQIMPDGVDQTYIFTIDGELAQHWTEHHRPAHGDMSVDADGGEVYVGISKSKPDEYMVIKRRIRDGAVTVLTAMGEIQHASMRATARPEWVFLTYAGKPEFVAAQKGWAPFAREVIALRIDGSGEMRRIAQTRSAQHDYWNEAQASPSPDGSQVIWSSNWGEAGGPVFDFVTRVDWPEQRP